MIIIIILLSISYTVYDNVETYVTLTNFDHFNFKVIVHILDLSFRITVIRRAVVKLQYCLTAYYSIEKFITFSFQILCDFEQNTLSSVLFMHT